MALYMNGSPASYKHFLNPNGMNQGANTDQAMARYNNLLAVKQAEAQLDAYDFSKKTAIKSANAAEQMAAKYLKKWNTGLQKYKGVFNEAIASIDEAIGMAKGTSADIQGTANKYEGVFDKLASDFETEYNDYMTQFKPVMESAAEGTMQALDARKGFTTQLQDLARPDYQTVSDRAIADVNALAAKAKEDEARRLASLGIDPTSGRANAINKDLGVDLALAGAMAGNQARMGEKNRVAGVTTAGLQYINPNIENQTAMDIQNTGSAMKVSQANVQSTGANVASNLANTRAGLASTAGNLAATKGNMASQYADVVVKPYQENYGASSGYAMTMGRSA